MTINIQPMLAKDKPALMQILRDTPEFKPSEVIVAEEVIDSYLRDSHGSGYHVLVAEAAMTVVGYICYGPTPLTENTWDIYWIAVDRERRGQGTGSALLEKAEEEIRQSRGRMAVIETSSTMVYEGARRFYLSHGYEVVGRITDFYAPGDDKLVLQKWLEKG